MRKIPFLFVVFLVSCSAGARFSSSVENGKIKLEFSSSSPMPKFYQEDFSTLNGITIQMYDEVGGKVGEEINPSSFSSNSSSSVKKVRKSSADSIVLDPEYILGIIRYASKDGVIPREAKKVRVFWKNGGRKETVKANCSIGEMNTLSCQ